MCISSLQNTYQLISLMPESYSQGASIISPTAWVWAWNRQALGFYSEILQMEPSRTTQGGEYIFPAQRIWYFCAREYLLQVVLWGTTIYFDFFRCNAHSMGLGGEYIYCPLKEYYFSAGEHLFQAVFWGIKSYCVLFMQSPTARLWHGIHNSRWTNMIFFCWGIFISSFK